jgi:hypothetical protein
MQRIDQRKLLAVDAFALGRTDADVAEQLDIDRSTAWRWRQDPVVRAELERRRDELWADALNRLPGLVGSALDVLGAALADDDRDAALQLLKVLRLGEMALEQRRVRTEANVDSPLGVYVSREDADAAVERFEAKVRRFAALNEPERLPRTP